MAIAPQTDDRELAEQMRLAMRRLAASVSIVTTIDAQGQHRAMTATSVTSLSLDPPALLVCVNRWAEVYSPLKHGQAFCVTILNHEQQALAEQCSRNTVAPETLTVSPWALTAGGLAYLPEAQAALVCHNDRSIDYGTHGVFIGPNTASTTAWRG